MLGMNRMQQKIFLALGLAVIILTGILITREYSRRQILAENQDFQNTIWEIGNEGYHKEKDGESESESIMVYITGQVKNPGVISLPEGSRLADAVEAAGGVLPDADLNRVNLALKVKDEGMYHIAAKGEDTPHDIQNPVHNEQPGSGKININTADEKQLETLSGIGPSRARMIIEYREKNGEFKYIEEIMNISGIGEKIFEGIRDHITVN